MKITTELNYITHQMKGIAMLNKNMKRKAYRRAKLVNNSWLLGCVFCFGYLFITGLLEAI